MNLGGVKVVTSAALAPGQWFIVNGSQIAMHPATLLELRAMRLWSRWTLGERERRRYLRGRRGIDR